MFIKYKSNLISRFFIFTSILIINQLFIGCSDSKNEDRIIENQTNDGDEKTQRYEDLKETGELFGAWTIENPTTSLEYDYEIYIKDGDYIGVNVLYKSFENLLRQDEKFIVKGNRYGEYYIIDDQLNLELYDNDGSLESAGYVARKK